MSPLLRRGRYLCRMMWPAFMRMGILSRGASIVMVVPAPWWMGGCLGEVIVVECAWREVDRYALYAFCDDWLYK